MRISDWSSDVCSSDLVEILGREARAEAAEAGDHLVEDQQDAMAVADLAQPLQIALRRYQNAGRTGDRLADHRGARRGFMTRDDSLQLVVQLPTRRSSCREKMLQYIAISVVTEPLKQK